MNAMDLLKKTQKKFVSSSSMSASESITYNHVSGTIVKNLRVFVDEENFNDSTREKGVINTTSFLNVFLDEEPTNKDTILYDSKTYFVKEWTKSTGMWIIHTVNNKRHAVTHRK